MPDDPDKGDSSHDDGSRESAVSSAAPSLSLPKGGGALRGIGEKFAVNPVTGTGSLTVPIYTSPGRAGFGPHLSLSYDSGAGNGPFGLGWSLAQPAITRKTDKGLPQYRDTEESDTFILSGSEDLMPALVEAGGQWVRDVSPPRTVYGQQYAIHRYRPRVEGLFARIERWVNVKDPRDTFWRSIARDNVTTWYGKTTESRIADPADPARIFAWLLSETSDGKGNVILYRYKPDDAAGVDVSQAHERNRDGAIRSANSYLKHVLYGNRTPYLPDLTAPVPVALPTDWCFELVFDYGEHDLDNPTPHDAGRPWDCRPDPFSTYRPAFELRTYRLCRRALMFHHFEDEPNVGLNCLVRSTDLVHAQPGQPSSDPTKPFYSFLQSAALTGYTRSGASGYLSRALPALEFAYSEAVIDETVRAVDPESLKNVPYGLDGHNYRWVDLDGEGLSGILTEQGGSWYYKPNWSPVNQRTENGEQQTRPQFGPLERVARQPSLAALGRGRQQLMDLSGDGQLDLVQFNPPAAGFFERTADAAWDPFTPFQSLPVVDWSNPNLKFIDLTGDGFADVLISEDHAFWWHSSLAAEGFGPAQRVEQALDEEKGPRLVFADSTESIFLADMSGDGLTDLVRVRLGEVCYWPNLGYGRFGAKVAMDGAPWFDRRELFDGTRIRLADIDGSGTADLVYFASGAVHLYFNQSGNAWGERRALRHFPSVESLSSATALDLLGNGTACLVWSSPLAANAGQPMRYIDLMGGQKPHLLVSSINNLGAEARFHYAPSTKFYVADKLAGTPWVTRLPFPVHVIERVESYDYISRNRFVTTYTYHHGYYDGVEREFRGFARVDQRDTEAFAALTSSGDFPQATNEDAASSVPPVSIATWFHTGAFLDGATVSKQLEQEYYREGDANEAIAGLTSAQLEAMILPDTVLPTTVLLPDGSRVAYDLSGEEMREACRALRGSILRQELYALDGTEAADRPYNASERNYTIEMLQPRGPNLYGVFLAHPRETIDFHYERKLFTVSGAALADPDAPPPGALRAADPRVTHALTLAVDPFGNVRQSAAVVYGRRYLDPALSPDDQLEQRATRTTYSESRYTNPVDDADAYRTPMPADADAYELMQVAPDAAPQPHLTALFPFEELRLKTQAAADGAHDISFEDRNPAGLVAGQPYRRLLDRTRILYRADDMGASAADARALLPLRTLESLALTGCQYRLAFTPGLIAQGYTRDGAALMPAPASVLGSVAEDGGGYVDLDGDGHWWIPSARLFYLPAAAPAPQEKAAALAHFFMPRRFENPFGHAASVDYDDPHWLVPSRTTDAAGNVSTAVTDYRVLQPVVLISPNGNQAAVTFDALALVAGSAVMGKTTEQLGDSLAGFTADLTQQQIDDFSSADDPHTLAAALLSTATQRVVYDLHRFRNTRNAAPDDPSRWQPAFAATIARETHVSDLGPNQQTAVQIAFTYSDGFNREIQKKVQAEPGPVVSGGPTVTPRWVGSGWTIFNNKGQPVRQYEPFFSQLAARGHQFEFGLQVGVSPILCYDPTQRVVATIHPNHTYEKVLFDPWRQFKWDVNDTVLETDPATDPDIGDFFRRLPAADYSPSWYAQRAGGGLGAAEQDAAGKAAAHAGTPSATYFDTLGRAFLTVADNGAAGQYRTRVDIDVVGAHLVITDALERKVMAYDYDMLAARIHQASIESGERWMLRDVVNKPIRSWDSRGFTRRFTYDPLRRDLELGVQPPGGAEAIVRRTIYGETLASPEAANLRGKVAQQFDTAGVLTNLQFDFKGNSLRSTRQLAANYSQSLDWSTPELLDGDVWTSAIAYDALNRPTAMTTPDTSVIRPSYNESNLLKAVAVNLRGAEAPSDFVTAITYDAKAQRDSITYANGAVTTYTYDPLTSLLVRVLTMGGHDTLQALRFTHDPTGNITSVGDDAQATIFFKNQKVTPEMDFVYDAVYRLIQATGREQIGLAAAPQPDWSDQYRINLPHPNDGTGLQRYTEHYQYDAVGNFLHVVHDAATGNWTRDYRYDAASLLEPARVGNRLSATVVLGTTEPYTYDAHGNMMSMPHLSSIAWNWADEIESSSRQAVNAGSGEKTWYVYDAAGQRVRKVTESQGGARVNERIYLSGFEVYREYGPDGVARTLERQTLHIRDDRERIALVESRTDGGGDAAPSVRYQFNNHLGSALLELDALARVITYEEYYPYGATSYQGVSTDLAPGAKRYRFTGKERDEESGFYYHGARYFAPWLGRWTSCDPAGLVDGVVLYEYTLGNPVIFRDRSGHQSTREVNNVFKALGAVRARVSALDFVKFLGQHEIQLFPMLSPYGYKGSRANMQDMVDEFDRTYRNWAKEYYGARSGPAAGLPTPVDTDREARKQMWAAAASDPIAAAVIGSGAIISATLGRLFGFEQDPTRAAAAGAGISNIVHAAGSLNSPHPVNEMVRQGETPQDRIKVVEGDHVAKADAPGPAPYGGRSVNTGAPGVDNTNCGQTTGALLDGKVGSSTAFAQRVGTPEGWTKDVQTLRAQYMANGNSIGPTVKPGSYEMLVKMMRAYPAGTNLAIAYHAPNAQGKLVGHVIAGMVGKNREILFIETQAKPIREADSPTNGVDFAFFPVTPHPR